jgi:hypothetical protein
VEVWTIGRVSGLGLKVLFNHHERVGQ